MFDKRDRIASGQSFYSLRLVFVGPIVLPQKMNFSSHMLRKAVCSLSDADPVFIFLPIYPFHPPMLFVSILKDAFSTKRKGLLGALIFRPVSITTSIRVGIIGPWLNMNALTASDQK